jgi:Ion channel
MESETVMRLVRGVLLIGGTGVVQVLAQLTLSRTMEILPQPRVSSRPTFYMLAHSTVAVLVLMAGHMLQVTMWALLYHFDWGEFHTFGSALYFSLASFTTAGAAELALSPGHRMVGALESAAGMLMFGWSTALLVRVVQRTDRMPERGEGA